MWLHILIMVGILYIEYLTYIRKEQYKVIVAHFEAEHKEIKQKRNLWLAMYIVVSLILLFIIVAKTRDFVGVD